LKIGLLTESVATDDQVYGTLLTGLVAEPVTIVPFEHRGGLSEAVRILPSALVRFVQAGVSLAIVALDNDQPPTHIEAHELEPQVHRDSCRTCGLALRVQHDDKGQPLAIPAIGVVPVPAIESWLAAAADIHETPEREEKKRLKYLVYRSASGSKKRVLERGVPLAALLGADAPTRTRVLARCTSFATFLRALGRALPGRLTTSSAPPPT
jgi:hypothetical protein